MSRPLAALTSLVLAVLGIVFLLPPECAYACSCSPVSVQRLLSSSEAVFSGEVVEVKKGPTRTYKSGGEIVLRLRYSRVILQASEVWKGPQRETLEVITERGGGSCGYPFKEGQEYLVYAYGKTEPFETDICNGTVPLSKADEDLAVLGNGETPREGGDEALTDTSGVVSVRAMVGLAVLSMAASLLVVVRLVRTG